MNNQENTNGVTANKNEVANAILVQLGGNRFIAMTGSKNFIAGEKSLTMRLTRNKLNAQFLSVELTDMDLYDLSFFSINKDLDRKEKASFQGVYAEDLQDIFESATGNKTKL